jgi:hypothetical protein
MLLYRTWHLQRGKTLEGDEGVGWNCLSDSAHLPAGPLRAEKGGRMSSNYYMRNRAKTIMNYLNRAKASASSLARLRVPWAVARVK